MQMEQRPTDAFVTATAEAHTVRTLVRAPATPSANRVGGAMTAEAAAGNATIPDATKAEKQVTAATEARIVLTPVQAAATAPSRVGSVMTAEAPAEDAMNAVATEVQALVIATAEASSVPTRCS